MPLVENVLRVDVIGELVFLQISAAVGPEADPIEALERVAVDIPRNACRIASLLAQPNREVAVANLAIPVELGQVRPPDVGEFRCANWEWQEARVEALPELILEPFGRDGSLLNLA